MSKIFSFYRSRSLFECDDRIATLKLLHERTDLPTFIDPCIFLRLRESLSVVITTQLAFFLEPASPQTPRYNRRHSQEGGHYSCWP
jgi:hypothetical protein